MSEAAGGKIVVTVGDFLKAGRARLELDLVAGAAGESRRIDEATMNRPGLALTGFYQFLPPAASRSWAMPRWPIWPRCRNRSDTRG